jgi:hypothetical protein
MNAFAEYVEWQKVTDNASFGKIEKFGLSYESQHILLSGGVVNNSYISNTSYFSNNGIKWYNYPSPTSFVYYEPFPTVELNNKYYKIGGVEFLTATVKHETSVISAANYGTWDGEYFWVGCYGINAVKKINADGVVVAAYSTHVGTTDYPPLQLAFDGQYIWVACGNTAGSLLKMDKDTGTILNIYTLNPTLLGAGGVQGIVFDGTDICVGVAQYGGGVGSGFVGKVNTTTGVLTIIADGQTNVNGIISANVDGEQYIYAACAGFVTKVKCSDGTYISEVNDNESYRIVTDGKYIYTASYYTQKVQRYNMSTLAKIDYVWASGPDLNCIAFDGNYIWTCGDDKLVTIIDPNSMTVVGTIPGGGKSDLIWDGQYMWSITARTVSEAGTTAKVSKLEITTINKKSVYESDNNVDWVATTLNAEFPTNSSYVAWVNRNKVFLYCQGEREIWMSIDMIYWDYVKPITLVPPYRHNGNGIYVDEKFYLMGGYNGETTLSDLWIASIKQPIINYTSGLWKGIMYEVLDNTFNAKTSYYNAAYALDGYVGKQNEKQNAFYRVGKMLLNKFKNTTSYETQSRVINKTYNVSAKATLTANLVATATPSYYLLTEAETHYTVAEGVTKATKEIGNIAKDRGFISAIATFIAQ